jgi:predicted nucleic acid-binding protein
LPTDELAASAITYGEIWFGLRTMPAGRRRQERERIASALFRRLPIHSVTREVAERYAAIKATLRTEGVPIPEADLWIAATSLVGDYVLVTRDDHFSRVTELRVEDWTHP